MSSDTDSCDILIVGAGIFGTSTAYHLSRTHPDPSRITLIDRASTPSPLAASSDINKIVRADYVSPFYMDLAFEAMDCWRSDPILSQYYHNTGWIALGEEDSDISERVRTNLKNSGRPDTSSDRTLEQVKTDWGGVLCGINTTGFNKAYFNSSAGWADASLAVSAWMREAVSRGIRTVAGEARLVTKDQEIVGVEVDQKLYTGTKILLATGAWTPYLMASVEHELKIDPTLSIDHQIRAAGVCVAAFTLNPDEAAHYSQMPVLIYGAKGEAMPPNHAGLFKFTNANTFLNTISISTANNKPISVPHPEQATIPPGLKRQSLDLIQRRVPQMLDQGRQPDYWRLCWDAVSPDQNQLICRHPVLSNLFFATAGSFHSWKFLPNIGRYVVNVLEGRSNGEDKDRAWGWKTEWSARGAHPKVAPQGEYRDLF